MVDAEVQCELLVDEPEIAMEQEDEEEEEEEEEMDDEDEDYIPSEDEEDEEMRTVNRSVFNYTLPKVLFWHKDMV